MNLFARKPDGSVDSEKLSLQNGLGCEDAVPFGDGQSGCEAVTRFKAPNQQIHTMINMHVSAFSLRWPLNDDNRT
jgi:hypothetical protein